MKITYRNASDEVTLEEAVGLYQLGVAVIVNDGKDVTFEIEERNSPRKGFIKTTNLSISCLLGKIKEE